MARNIGGSYIWQKCSYFAVAVTLCRGSCDPVNQITLREIICKLKLVACLLNCAFITSYTLLPEKYASY